MQEGCGTTTGHCGCGAQAVEPEDVQGALPTAHVNGVALHAPGEQVDEPTLRQRACTELLRQAAQRRGLLSYCDEARTDGATSAEATQAIEQLLEQALDVLEPSPEACRRYYEAHEAQFRQGEKVRLRHVLFGVTPGVDVQALRARAEAQLLSLRCAQDDGEAFAAAARNLSNCPSGQQGGELGWITRTDCAEEFAKEVFGSPEIGVLSRLVHSRFGLHVVEVLERDAGHVPAFELVHGAVSLTLRQQSWINALRQYLPRLASEAHISGVQLEGADSPLVQ